jgi:chitinase
MTPTPPPPPPYDLRANVGGPAYTDGGGDLWLADKAYSAGSWGYIGGQTHTVANAIENTTDDVLYQSERFWPSGGSYKFDLANGTYRVELKFAETYYSSPNSRKFNVSIEGVAALTNFDAWHAAGGKFKAVDRVFIVHVVDGQLNIDFQVITDAPILSAVRVTRQ